jgi:hypothetical protein
MNQDYDQNFRSDSQQYLKNKAERREAQQRFFEENLNEREIFKTQLQTRSGSDQWMWMPHDRKPEQDSKKIIEESTPVDKEGTQVKEVVGEAEKKEEDANLESLLLGDGEEGYEEEAEELGIVEPEVVLGKIEGFLDVLLKCSLNNYIGKKKKRDKSKGERKSSNSKRKKYKKRDKKVEEKVGEMGEVKPMPLKLEDVKVQPQDFVKLDKAPEDILKIGELLRTTNS